MVSHLFFYQLTLIVLVWLCVMLQWVWPSDSAAGCPTPLAPHLRQDKLEIIEDEGILHEVKHFPCCLQEKYPCSCP